MTYIIIHHKSCSVSHFESCVQKTFVSHDGVLHHLAFHCRSISLFQGPDVSRVSVNEVGLRLSRHSELDVLQRTVHALGGMLLEWDSGLRLRSRGLTSSSWHRRILVSVESEKTAEMANGHTTNRPTATSQYESTAKLNLNVCSVQTRHYSWLPVGRLRLDAASNYASTLTTSFRGVRMFCATPSSGEQLFLSWDGAEGKGEAASTMRVGGGNSFLLCYTAWSSPLPPPRPQA